MPEYWNDSPIANAIRAAEAPLRVHLGSTRRMVGTTQIAGTSHWSNGKPAPQL
jgi:hypothetical protein